MTERENLLRLFRGELPFWVPDSQKSMLQIGQSLLDLERPHMSDGYDWFGVHWIPQAMTSSIITHPDINQEPVISDIEEWKTQLVFPNLDAIDWDYHGRLIKEELKRLNGRLPYFLMEHGIFERLTLLMGFENCLIATVLEPEACREYAEAMADFKINLYDRIAKLAPLNLVLYMDDIGTGSGPIFSLDTFRSINPCTAFLIILGEMENFLAITVLAGWTLSWMT